MNKFQDYYGDYYGAEADNCDPYYEECDDVEVNMEEEEMMMEEESSVSPLVMLWGIVPALDIVSGYFQLDDWE